jgi:hypothetical protein
MRRKDREITEIDKLLEIIKKCKVCRLGLSDNGLPYIVPLNFGWNYDNNRLTLYFHSAIEGRKLDIIKSNNRVCFEIDTDHKLYVEGEDACKHGYLYTSVIGFGCIEFINNPEEKSCGLNMVMKHQTDKDTEYQYSAESLARVCVYKMIVDNFSGKARQLQG